MQNEHLSEAQRLFIELDKEKSDVVKFFDRYQEIVKALENEMTVGDHFQDDEGTVYQLSTREGKFVHFEPVVVNRTRRLLDEETKGTLSLTKARELGYEVEGK